jgi:uncharacterized SAM-binding protein YcdF (DUF218 family)
VIIIPSGREDESGMALASTGKDLRLESCFQDLLYLLKETRIDLMKVYAGSLGALQRDIWVDHDSGSTVENALFAEGIVQKNECQSVLVITSPTHSRRTKMVFNKIFPKEISVRGSCDPSTFDVKKRWKIPARAREVGYEYFVFLCYTLFGF